MRNFIIWTLSVLLGFEPALWAEGTARQQAEIKSFLEKTEIAKKPVSIRELYEKNSFLLTASEKQSLKTFVDTYGDQKLPKMDVIKVKASGGKEFYQLQAVQNGKSVSLEVINENGVFARLNGTTLTMADMQSVPDMMIKAGVPAADAQKVFKRSPASAKSPILSADQLLKLTPQDRAQYFKQLRQLLESMEAVGTSFEKHKTSFNEPMNKFEFIAQWLQGEPAFARADGQCVAAGWVATAGRDRNGRLKCGTDGDNGVADQYRRKADGSLCPKDKFACNPAIYGGGRGADLCIAGSRDTTRLCNERIVGQDIPDLNQKKDEFEKLRVAAVSEAESVMAVCTGGGPASDAPSEGAPEEQAPPSKKKASKKAGKKSGKKSSGGGNPYAGLDEDQQETCRNFKQRYDEIQSWGCDKPDFASKYPAICKETKPDIKPDPTPVQPVNPAPAPVSTTQPGPTGPKRCDQLPLDQAPVGTLCEGGNVSNLVGPGDITCVDANGQEVRIAECKCDSGSMVSRFKCAKSGGGNAGGGTDGDSGRRKKKEKEGGLNWLLIGAVGLGGLLLFHWLNKKAVDEQYKQIEPVPPAPPVPPPTVTVPAPRGVI